MANLPTVVLEHRMPDGSRHFDWMIARDEAGRAGLLTFRMQRNVRTLCAGDVEPAERLVDHRPAYLAYEGPVSGGRGEVRRVAAGNVIENQVQADALGTLRIAWDGRADEQEVALEGQPDAPARHVRVLS